MDRRLHESTSLGRDLRRRRGDRSLREMAALSKRPPCAGRVSPVSPTTLHQIERGARLPGVEHIRTLALLYHLPLRHFYELMDADDRAAGDGGEDFIALRREASLYREAEDSGRYLSCLLQCEEAAEDDRNLVWVRRARAEALCRRGRAAEAASLLLEILSRPGVPDEETASLWADATEALLKADNLEVAEAAARRGIARCLEEDVLTRARLEALLGRTVRRRWEELGDDRGLRAAVRHLEKAVGLLEECAQEEAATEVLVELGRAHLAEGSSVLGLEVLRRAAKRARRLAAACTEARALKALGEALIDAGRLEEAGRALVRAESLAASVELRDVQFGSLVLLAAHTEAGERGREGLLRRAQAVLPWLRGRIPERGLYEELLRGICAAAVGF